MRNTAGPEGGELRRPSVLALALDSSEWTLIERWTRDGTMPNLKRLYEQGARCRLISTADWLAGTPWPSFYTGSYPPDHGFLFHLQWRPDRMRHERPRPEWLPMTPFYRRFGDFDKRVIAIDVPITYGAESLNGIEVTSWSTHDKLASTGSYPKDVMNWINREIGSEPIVIECGGAQKVGPLLRLRDSLIDSTKRQASLCEALMAREPWDFFIVGIGATHRAGHKLWDRSSVLEMTPDQGEEYDHALRDVYIACDTAVGRILEAAGRGVTVLCFALHGMGTNTSRFGLVPEMLERVLSGHRSPTRAPKPKYRSLQKLRAAVPLEWRSAVKQHLPEGVQDALSTFWLGVDSRDWSKTRAFALMGDLQALVQINLRGRETEGIVEPGPEFEELCGMITDGLLTFRDRDTGERVIDRIGRGDRLYPEARYDVGLPDLVIRWNDTPAVSHRAIVSPRYGTIDWPHPGRPLDGRSGHHGPPGWLIATGDHIQPGVEMESATAFDLNATIHDLVGVPQPQQMLGEIIPELRRA